MIEEWKDIPGYEGLYQISNTGKIKKILFSNNIVTKKYNKLRKIHLDKAGYLKVILTKNGISKNHLIHRLVAETFIPNPNNLPQVNHKNEIKNDNRVENLEWCTRKYNCSYGTRTKRIVEKAKITKKGKHYSPSTEFKKGQNAKKVINITTNKIYNSMQDAFKDTGISTSNICSCCKGRIKQTKGYIWQYYLAS